MGVRFAAKGLPTHFRNRQARGPGRGRAWRALLAAVVAGLVIFLVASPAPHSAQSTAGELDPTFGGGDGRVNDNFDGVGRGDQANAVVVQPDGKIVVAAQTPSQERGHDFGLARYNPDGTLDPSFGSGGKVLTNFPYPNFANDRPHALALQPDGKIVAAGTANADFALARYNPDGSLDQTFGAGGLVVTDFFGGGDTAYGVALQPDGKIVAAGQAFRPNSTGSDFAAARYNPDGSPDTTFGDAAEGGAARRGRVATDFAAWNDIGRGLALQADGKIVVAGHTQTPSTERYDFALVRYAADGTLDPAFDGDGRVTTAFFGDAYMDDERAFAVRVQADGRIVAAGFAFDRGETAPASGGEDFALARYNPDGSLDATFGGDGLVVTNIFVADGGVNDAGIASRDRAHALLLQPDGKLVAGGFASCCSNDGTEDFALARYNQDGTLDPAFGAGDGITRTDFFGRFDTDDEIYGMALQPDGRVVAVGRAEKNPRLSNYDYAVARYTAGPVANPTPTPAYTIRGQVKLDVNPMPGVAVTLGGAASATATTDADGNYSFAGLAPGFDYTVTAARDGYIFSPPGYTFHALSNDKNASFAASPVVGGGRTNFALASQGGVASASSTTSQSELPGMSFPASAVNNGDRKGLNWEQGGGWRDGTNNAFPDWLQVDFASATAVDEINVFSLQDNYTSPSEPTEAMTFTKYGVTVFEVQYWDGSGWAAVPGGVVTNNGSVWRRLTFPAVTTTKVRVVISNALAGRSRLVELEAWGVPAAARVNHAAASNGGVASASSTTTQQELPGLDFSPAGVINGDRRGTGWEHGGGWRDGTNNAFPDWLQVDFDGTRKVDEVSVFSLQDNYTSPSEPTGAMTFTKYGVTSFEVQYWDGSQWATVPGGAVTGNSLVWRKVTFPAVTTGKVRIVVNNALGGRSRIVEVEAVGPAP
ncbi:MAG TPA: discoidin domain-containing protein [Pyrinomonadaceae bacterium]|jgi:uncharacterized delta-60 repeat protein